MLPVIINFFLYLSVLLFHWRKFKVIDNAFLLLAMYAFISLACVFNYISAPQEWEGISIFPLLYLFCINLMFFRPFLINNNTIIEKVQIKNSPIYFIFIYLYIILSGVVVYYGYQSAVLTVLKNDWNAVRADVYSGDSVLYTNQLERFAKIFTGFLQPMAILFLFYLLSEEFLKKRFITIFLLFLAAIIPSLLTIISVASRGLVVLLIFQFLVCYFIFRKNIAKRTNKIIATTALVFLGLFLTYSISVTVSRFGESSNGGSADGAQNSLIFYFGHSMLTFSYGIVDTIKEFLWGKYIFGNQEILTVGIDNLLGTHFGTNFCTYVGALYLDFGPFFTFIIALVFPFLMSMIFRYKKKLDIADLMIYVYYLTFLLNGVFVIGIGYYIGWLIIFIIYIIFKTIKFIA